MTYKPRTIDTVFPIHITARSNNREAFPMALPELWELFSDYLHLIHKFYGTRIHSFVMMPNHFHLIARDPEGNLPSAMNYFMRETSKLIGRETGRINKIWGAPFHSSVISSPLYYLHAYKYVYRNPARAHLIENPFDYKYSTLPALIGRASTVIPVECDDTLFESFESSVEWLCQKSRAQEVEDVRLALRRKRFTFPRDERTKKPNFLETEESVPRVFRKGRAFPDGKALPPADQRFEVFDFFRA